MDYKTQCNISLAKNEISGLSLSIPAWNIIADPRNGFRGFLRHGVSKATDTMPPDCKIPYTEHLASRLRTPYSPNSTWLLVGTRNSVQNLFLPVFDSSRKPSVLARPDEPIADSLYQALCIFEDGDWAIQKIRFSHSEQTWNIHLPDIDSTRQPAVRFAITGQPLLWDGDVVPHHLIAAVTYDQRHAWHLQWEDWQRNDTHVRVHQQLMDTMMSSLALSTELRAAALMRIACEAGLREEDGYVHSSLGTGVDGSIKIVMMTGSFSELAAVHRSIGSSRAILLDNGGSVGMAIWHGRDLMHYQAGSGEIPSPTYIGNNSYFRPRGHAVIAMEVRTKFTERAFAYRLAGDAAWSMDSQ